MSASPERSEPAQNDPPQECSRCHAVLSNDDHLRRSRLCDLCYDKQDDLRRGFLERDDARELPVEED